MGTHIWYLEAHIDRAHGEPLCVRNVEIECRNGVAASVGGKKRTVDAVHAAAKGFSACVSLSLLLFCFASVFRSHPRPLPTPTVSSNFRSGGNSILPRVPSARVKIRSAQMKAANIGELG